MASPPDYAARHFWEQVARSGCLGLTRMLWDSVELHMPENGRVVFRVLIQNMEQQTRWIAEARAELVGEAARAAEIGLAMKRAGLRSYTDKEGRIYVADDR